MIRRVAIVGAGTMGTGIAITCLAAGLPTTLIDTANTALGRAKDRIYGYFVREVDKGRMTPGQKERAVQFLTLSTGLEAPTGADLTIEAVFDEADGAFFARRFNRCDKHFLLAGWCHCKGPG